MTKKTSAPVGVTLNSDRIAGTVTVELNAVASADCPDARYQFKVPPGVDVMEGPVSKRVGTLSKGRGLRARLVLRVPLGKPTLIAAGVTCQVAPNAALVKSAVLTLGTPPQPTAGVARKLQVKGTGMNLNIAPAVQLKSDKVDGTGR